MLAAQVAGAKRQLSSLVISDAAYQELLSMPATERSLADAARVCMHEGLLQLKLENEALRLASQVSNICFLLCARRAHGLWKHARA